MVSIIDKIVNRISEMDAEYLKRSDVIDLIREMEEGAEFEESARVLVKHMNSPDYDPHQTAIVTSTSIQLVSGKISRAKIFDYLID